MKKQSLKRTIPIMIVAVTAGIAISLYNGHKDEDVNNLALLILIPVMTAAVWIGITRGINRQKGLFESYTLTITSNTVTRTQMNTPTISLYFNEIREIAKNKNGSFTIKGTNAADVIGIPAQIENYDALEIALGQIKPITVNGKTNVWANSPLLSLLTVGMMVCVYIATNKIIVAVNGAALVALMVWSFYKILQNKNVDAKTKRGSYFILLALASVIGVMIYKLTA